MSTTSQNLKDKVDRSQEDSGRLRLKGIRCHLVGKVENAKRSGTVCRLVAVKRN